MYPLVMANRTMENGPLEIVSFPMKHGGFFHSYDNLPEGRKDQIPWICRGGTIRLLSGNMFDSLQVCLRPST